MSYSKRWRKKNIDFKSKMIKNQSDEIELLKSKIASLEIDCEEKDEIINSVDSMMSELSEVISELRKKSEEYDNVISELKKMRAVMNEEVFKGRWNIIRLFMK